MFGALFSRECKQILKSLVYYLYILVLALFLSTQLKDSDWAADMEKPQPGQESYGMKASQDEQVIMGKALANLIGEVERESFATYPFAFYKEVTPTEDELETIRGIVESCTGKSWDTLLKEEQEHYQKYDLSDAASSIEADQTYTVEPRKDLTYSDFKSEMEKVTEIIGKGSSYEESSMEAGAYVPMTYEEALKEYREICENDKITGAYMRLFCDYAGIMLAFLPMFLGVTRCLRDKRADAMGVIHAKSASSAKIILSRYLANVFLAFVPVVIIGFFLQLPYCYHAHTLGIKPDYIAFLTYPLIWLLPEIMIVMALAFFVTEMTDKIIGVFIQIFWMMADEFSNDRLVGDFGMKLAVRWNTVGETANYLAQRQELYLNRSIYALASVGIILLTVAVYEKKRKEGECLYAKVFKNRH